MLRLQIMEYLQRTIQDFEISRLFNAISWCLECTHPRSLIVKHLCGSPQDESSFMKRKEITLIWTVQVDIIFIFCETSFLWCFPHHSFAIFNVPMLQAIDQFSLVLQPESLMVCFNSGVSFLEKHCTLVWSPDQTKYSWAGNLSF